MTITGVVSVMGQETLPALKDGVVPKTYEELWAGYDPRKEPLDVEVLKEWEEDGVVLKVLRYLQTHSYQQGMRLRLQPGTHRDVEALMLHYITYILERKLKSVEFLYRLRREQAQ